MEGSWSLSRQRSSRSRNSGSMEQLCQLAISAMLMWAAPGKANRLCTVSWLEGYECVHRGASSLGPVFIHWQWATKSIHVAVEVEGSGWLGMAFPPPGTTELAGSDLLILLRKGEGLPAVKTYTVLRTQGGQHDLQEGTRLEISGVSTSIHGTIATLRFQRAVSAADDTSVLPVLWALGRSSTPTSKDLLVPWSSLAIPYSYSARASSGHGQQDPPIRQLSQQGGSALRGVVTSLRERIYVAEDMPAKSSVVMPAVVRASSGSRSNVSPIYPVRNAYASAHGALMWLAFFVLLPLGILVARHARASHCWFHLHWILQAVGSALVAAGLALALLKLDASHSVHGRLGLGVAALLLLHLLVAALLRPPVGARHRSTWYAWHVALGLLALGAGLANCWLGMHLYSQHTGLSMEWAPWALLGQIALLALLALLLEVFCGAPRELEEPVTPPSKMSSRPGSMENLSRSPSSRGTLPKGEPPAFPELRLPPRHVISVSKSMKGRMWSPSMRFTPVEL